jgi:hypothetical protein
VFEIERAGNQLGKQLIDKCPRETDQEIRGDSADHTL